MEIFIMIDTLELTYSFNSQYFNEIFKGINALIKTVNDRNSMRKVKMLHKEKNGFQTTAFWYWWFLEFKIASINRTCLAKSKISIKFKPAIYIHSQNKYALTNYEDYDQTRDVFNRVIGMINSFLETTQLPEIDAWEIKRIDFAFQLETIYYLIYLKLFQKCYKNPFDNIYNTSFYTISKNTNINFYDKTVQLGLEDEYHVLRFEIQCKRKYLQHLKDKKRIVDITLKELWSKRISNVVKQKIKEVIGSNDFFNIERAEVLLDEKFSSKKAERVLQFLRFSTKDHIMRSDMPYAFAMLNNQKYGNEYVKNKIIPSLNMLNINPLIIPDYFGIEHLENPLHLLDRDI